MKINLDGAALAFIVGSASLLITPKLLSTETKIVILVVILLGSFLAGVYRIRSFWHPVAFLLSGLLWSFHVASLKVNAARPWVDKQLSITGTVKQINLQSLSGLTPATSFHRRQQISFEIRTINGKPIPHSVAIELNWRRDDIPVLAGQCWQLQIISRAIHAHLNEGTFDVQRFFASKGTFLRGRVLRAKLIADFPGFRQRIISGLVKELHSYSQWGLMVALLFGERQHISKEQSMILNNAGIAHLMAISGLHVLLVATCILRVLKWVCSLFPPFNATYLLLISSLIGTAFYVFLAGMNPPALRALLGFTGYVFLKLQKVKIAKSSCFVRFMALLIAVDPLLVLSDSFWLSCFAALSLLFLYCFLPLPKFTHFFWLKQLLSLLHLQLGLGILLLPIQIHLFNGISTGGLWVNLVAVPLMGIAIMPLLMSSMVLFLCHLHGLAAALSYCADLLLCIIMYVASSADHFWVYTSHHWGHFSFIGWLGIIMIKTEWWLRFKQSMGLLLLVLFGPFFIREHVHWRVDMLDVGPGLAIIIRQNNEAVIYDSGQRYGSSSEAEKHIIPFLRWQGLTPLLLILSHEHSDHIGSYAALKKAYPNLKLVSSSLALPNDKVCIAGQKWHWQNLQFDVLWPLTRSSRAADPRSCVIRVSDGKFSVLLTGDILRKQEQKLITRYPHYPNTILQVPHHGSYTSSSFPFLNWVNPVLAINSAARYNPWHLPAIKIMKRYSKLQIPVLSTHKEGQISLYFFKDHWSYATLRHTIKPRWYHDWFGALNKYG